LKEKQQSILKSIEVKCSRDQAAEMFDKYITESFVVNVAGDKVPGVEAFSVNLAEEYKKPLKDRQLPVYVANKDGKTYYIFPVYGKGLWGPIWGYVAVEDDLNTIYGVTFDHKGETPGLGAEIATDWFQAQFKGKKLFDDNGNFVSIAIVKGGAPEGDKHAVDAISGGTITSKGLEAMLRDFLAGYVNFMNKQRTAANH
jgi:Na+-transporting NADH:ubiquinone oxidoreductase subunit C